MEQIRLKKCIGPCERELPEADEYFYFVIKRKKILNNCRSCVLKRKKNYRELNKDKIKSYDVEWQRKNRKHVNEYRRLYYKDFDKRKKKNNYDNMRYVRECIKINTEIKKKHKQNPIRRMFNRARTVSKKNNWDFDLILEDIVIPSVCPVLGIQLYVSSGTRRDNSPTIDRIDNTKGYIKGNIVIISWRANRLKSDSSFKEREQIYLFYKQYENIA